MYFHFYTTDQAFIYKRTFVFQFVDQFNIELMFISLPLNLKSISRRCLESFNFSQFALHANKVLIPFFCLVPQIFCENKKKVAEMTFLLHFQVPDHQHQKCFLQMYCVIFTWKTYCLNNILTKFNWRHEKLIGLWFCYSLLPFS